MDNQRKRAKGDFVSAQVKEADDCLSNAILASYLQLLAKYRDTPAYREFLSRLGVTEVWLSDRSQWHDIRFHARFHRALRVCFPLEEQISFRAAHGAFSRPGAQLFSSLIGLLITPKAIWSRMPRIAARMNTYNTFEFRVLEERIGFSRGLFTQLYGDTTDPEIAAANAELCEASMGSGLGILNATGCRLIEFKEHTCVRRGDARCEYEYVWFNSGTFLGAARYAATFCGFLLASWLLPFPGWGKMAAAFVLTEAVSGLLARLRTRRLLDEVFAYQQRTLEDLRRLSIAREEMNQSLMEYQRQLSESIRLAAIGEESCKLIHDLASPLTLLTMYSGLMQKMLREKFPDEKELNRYNASIAAVTVKMKGLQSIFRRMARNDNFAAVVVVDLAMTIREILEIHAPLFERGGIAVSYACEAASPLVRAPEGALESVVINLLQNASKAIENQERRSIGIRISESDTELALTISDSGPGIGAERLAALWTQFGPSNGGSGYGLYLVKKTIDQMQGRVSVTSTAVGTTMAIAFRKARPGDNEPCGLRPDASPA